MEPVKLKRAILKEELLAITGDPISAIVLNQFLYWSERVKDFDSYIAEENERRKFANKEPFPLTHGWIYKSAQELSEEIMIASRASVQRAIKKLIDLGYIEERENPEYPWDRTKQYRVNLNKIIQDLAAKGFTLQGYRYLDRLQIPVTPESDPPPIAQDEQCIAHSEQSIAQSERSIAHNEQTIPNIISKTITDIFSLSLYSEKEKEKIIKEIVLKFYNHLGQQKVSKTKLNKGIKTINQLLEDGFSITEIALAINWALKNMENIYSIAIIQDIIGQALSEHKKFTEKREQIIKQQEEHKKMLNDFLKTQEKLKLIAEIESKLDEETKEKIKKQAERELAKEGITPDNLVYKILLQLKINDLILLYGTEKNLINQKPV